MADAKPEVRNKRLLLAALGLGLLVVVIYNVHISMVRNAGKDKMVLLAKFNGPKAANTRLMRKDVELVSVSAAMVKGLGGKVVTLDRESDFDRFTKDPIVVPVEMNEWLRNDMFPGADTGTNYHGDPTMRGHVLQLDPASAPGEGLRPGQRVDIWAQFVIGGGTPKFYRVFQSVRVLAVGGFTGGAQEGSSAGPGRQYRQITIEVKPKVSEQLYRIEPMMSSPLVRIDTLHPEAAVPANAGEISEDILAEAKNRKLLDEPKDGMQN